MAPEPIVATYSIVACDLDAAQWGVAVQSKFLAVGSVVPWAEPGVGAVATQAYANPRYGPDGLALLRDGLDAEAVVQRLVEADDGRDERRVRVVDRPRLQRMGRPSHGPLLRRAGQHPRGTGNRRRPRGHVRGDRGPPARPAPGRLSGGRAARRRRPP